MVSDILNTHPDVLSLSEFFSYVGIRTFSPRRASGERMWAALSRQRRRTRLMLQGSYEELAYPVDDPGARFDRRTVPPIMCATLPHLTRQYEELFDELAPVVRAQPRQAPADHVRQLAAWLCARFGSRVWVERSGGSLLFGGRLLQEFPDARVIHVYRDGRETAISMQRHYLFRMIVASMWAMRSFGFDALRSMSSGKYWERIIPLLEPLTSALVNPARLPYDKLTLADFGAFWNGMIERGERMFGHFPPDRLLPLRFEDVQAEPEAHIRRLIRFIDPALDDDAWVRQASTIPRPTPSKFAQLPAHERTAVTQACLPGLERLGYQI